MATDTLSKMEKHIKKMDADFQLVPLRIPTGWVTLFNNFTDETPVIERGSFLNADHFSQDILRLQQYRSSKNNVQLAIDLGWYPSEDISGCYRVTLENVKQQELGFFRVMESKDHLEIQRVIDEWLGVIARYPHDYDSIKYL